MQVGLQMIVRPIVRMKHQNESSTDGQQEKESDNPDCHPSVRETVCPVTCTVVMSSVMSLVLTLARDQNIPDKGHKRCEANDVVPEGLGPEQGQGHPGLA